MKSRVLITAAVLAGVALFLAVPPSSSAPPPASGYTGSGSCASSQCHGSLNPRTDNRVPQNENTVWVTRDRHSQAYSDLLGERSRLIAGNLKISTPPHKDARCLDCHAVNVPRAQRGRTFDIAEGVSCEACHGPAERWLGPHTTRGWTHARSVAQGMLDTKDALKRVEACARCHVGREGRIVSHELYAAGHPELVFEAQWYTGSMPPHWTESSSRGAFFSTRLWAVGTAVLLREQMPRSSKMREGPLAACAEFDCGSCHHALTAQSWRQKRGYKGRFAGDPPIDLSRWRLLAQLTRRVAPELATEIEAAARELASAGRSIQAPAARIARAADTLAKRLNGSDLKMGRDETIDILNDLSGNSDPAREFGYRGAAQLAMSIESLSRPIVKLSWVDRRAVEGSVSRLFDLLETPSAYDPAKFEKALDGVSLQISKLKQGR